MSDFVEQFHKTFSLSSRKQQSSKITSKYPNRVAVIVDRARSSDPKLDKNKFLVPANLTLAQLVVYVRKHLPKPNATQAYSWHIYPTQVRISMTSLVSNLLAEHGYEDGFLVLLYSLEEAFGGGS